MSYGVNFPDLFRRAADYDGRGDSGVPGSRRNDGPPFQAYQ
jgi:hypothetical protein